jgi:hypothetical protein
MFHWAKISWLFQVGLDHIDQLFRAFGLGGIAFPRRVDDMNSNVVLDDLCDQAIQGAACRYDEMEHVRAGFLLFECPLNGLDLASDPAHPV